MANKRKYPFGAECFENGVDFRVFAQERSKVDVIINGKTYPLEKEKDGFFGALIKEAKEKERYFYLLDEKIKIADPASRFQPEGIEGPSEIVNSHFNWQDSNWQGIKSLKQQVIYELHVGTFTKEGTYRALCEKLPYLKDLGVTIIELMPVNTFAGRFGWGYDGIFLFAPHNGYGTATDLKAFINKAHLLGISVILDVVYNHFGPDLILHKHLTPDFFHSQRSTDWGDAINYDLLAVRQFFIANALYWLDEYHFDGLRFDATQDIHDTSEKHILKEIEENVRKKIARDCILIAENEPQNTALIKNYHLDGLWNDDFHHSCRVALTGKKEAYYTDYHGSMQELLSSIKYGFLYQGQYYSWQNKNRGSLSLDIPHDKFVIFLENHDQVANSPFGLRLNSLCQGAKLRALTTLFLLAPQTSLLFQGQEWGSKTPFNFFADHNYELNLAAWAGRKKFMEQFASFNTLDQIKDYADPGSFNTFENSKLDWENFDAKTFEFHKTLIALRKQLPFFDKVDGAVINDKILLIRYFSEGNDILLLCNFGNDFLMQSISEPLFAPSFEKKWRLAFSSNEPCFGGLGNPPFKEPIWTMPANTTYVLMQEPL